MSFTIATRKIKLHEDKFNQTFKNLDLENYSTLKNEIEEDTNKWKHILCSWIGRIHIIKMSIIFKVTYRSIQFL